MSYVEEPVLEINNPQNRSDKTKKHSYKLRFGYDPRIFLEDPRLRGQQVSSA